ncbi:MAG: hypothetical protein QNJ36_14555, partial [Calothrix sp. MO_167.B42]|nr:hypothetical protein [Calothrix sp. MO_167.B42]
CEIGVINYQANPAAALGEFAVGVTVAVAICDVYLKYKRSLKFEQYAQLHSVLWQSIGDRLYFR